MNETEIGTALHEVQDAVRVPPHDAAAVSALTSRLRRRRRVARLAGGATFAAIAVTGVVLPSVLGDGDDDGATSDAAATAAPATGVPVGLAGHVQRVGLDGTVTDTGLSGDLVGISSGEVVVLDGDRLLWSGGREIDGVQSAYADPDGVTYQTEAGAVRRSGSPGIATAGPGRLVAAGEQGVVLQRGDSLIVEDVAGPHRIVWGSDVASAVDDVNVSLAGATVLVSDGSTVQFFDLDGERRSGFLGGTTGRLASDGDVYAYAPSARESAMGMVPGLARTATGRGAGPQRTPLPAAAIDLAWYEDVPYVVTEADGDRVLWRCATDCTVLLEDPSGTLTLH